MPTKGTHPDKVLGREWPRYQNIGNKTMAAIDTRANTTVKGGNSLTATPAKKYPLPHKTERKIKKLQSCPSICLGAFSIFFP
jgi:hypothetical protein